MLFFCQCLPFFFSKQKPENLLWPKGPCTNCPLVKIFTLFPISPCWTLVQHTGLILVSWIKITRCSQLSVFLVCSICWGHSSARFPYGSMMLSHYILSSPALKIETSYNLLHSPSTLSCIFFHSTYNFLNMLSYIMIYCLLFVFIKI